MIGYEKGLFKIRGIIGDRLKLILQIGGFALFLLIWYLLTAGVDPIVNKTILPKPINSWNALFEMLENNELIMHIGRSLGRNLAGYIEAIVLGVVFGYLIALFPIFRGLFQKQVDALRFVPLTAVTSLFILWFGLGDAMKVHFLAFGIFIYLLPVVVQRVDDVESVYLKTVYTLGASNWQIIKTVFVPHALSKVIDDIRVLTAISWTYIIIAEMLGSEGGVGALLWRMGQRIGRVDALFTLIILIVLIGVLQDKIFTMLDRHFFPHKYQTEPKGPNAESKPGWSLALSFLLRMLFYVMLAFYLVLIINEYTGLLTSEKILTYYFGGTVHVVNATAMMVIGYTIYDLVKNRNR